MSKKFALPPTRIYVGGHFVCTDPEWNNRAAASYKLMHYWGIREHRAYTMANGQHETYAVFGSCDVYSNEYESPLPIIEPHGSYAHLTCPQCINSALADTYKFHIACDGNVVKWLDYLKTAK
jgi:hypothetical protein